MRGSKVKNAIRYYQQCNLLSYSADLLDPDVPPLGWDISHVYAVSAKLTFISLLKVKLVRLESAAANKKSRSASFLHEH